MHNMIKTVKTNSKNLDFVELVKQLDTYLAIIDGEEHSFYAQFNKIDLLNYVVIAYDNDNPIGCGAMKQIGPNTMEVKRMFTSPSGRKKGVATTVLNELENWALTLGFSTCVLETGIKQTDAVSLYQKTGYQIIENYGQYIGVVNSICFEKKLN